MSWIARTLERIIRTNKRAHEQTNKQYQKWIIIMITIMTRHWVRSMHSKGDTSSLDQRFEH